MGASPNDYAHAAPHHSFIHVDDFESPEKLAEYLHTLDTNDYLYNKYFEWKGTGRFINTFFWCRVCALLHDQSRARHVYDDLDTWWRGPNVCIGRQRWKDVKKNKHLLSATGFELVSNLLT
ncbi:hypothetical protein DPMN_006453 [Dreissena polymorpha]|nr:hypothetical protein DPMN_006453 [Dreissena polymorpha]